LAFLSFCMSADHLMVECYSKCWNVSVSSANHWLYLLFSMSGEQLGSCTDRNKTWIVNKEGRVEHMYIFKLNVYVKWNVLITSDRWLIFYTRNIFVNSAFNILCSFQSVINCVDCILSEQAANHFFLRLQVYQMYSYIKK
jgi:hypothetical protein